MKISTLITNIIALFWALSFAAGVPVWAQQTDNRDSQRKSVTINTALVITWANILNKKDGSVVKGLESEDFLLREDDNPQQISLLKEDQPLSVVILVKTGPCGTWPRQWSFGRSPEALGQLGDDTEVALMAWEGDVVLTQPLTKILSSFVGFFCFVISLHSIQ